MSEGSGRQKMERRIVQRSVEDEDFRQRLLADPRATVEEELGTRLPEEVRVEAVEETADTIYLVLPFRSTDEQEAGALSDQDLEAVAGGTWAFTCGCSTADYGGGDTCGACYTSQVNCD